MAADPAQAFSNALGQGLGIMKSYRDEARLDEETKFNRTLALSAEERAKGAERRAEQNQGILVEENQYQIGRRPFKEKVEQTQLTGFELNNEGQKQQNEWYPKIQQENIRSSRDTSSRGWAQIGLDRQRINLARQQAIADQEERESRNAFRSLISSIQTNDFQSISNQPKIANSILRLAGAAAGAPQILAAMQNPTGDWLRDPKSKRAVLNVAAIDLGKTAKNLGFQIGSVSVADIRPSKVKGKVDLDFVGINPKTGRIERRVGNMEAARLFDKASVFANTMERITNDPRARSSMVSAMRNSDPEMYGEMLNFEISRREKAIKGIQDRTIKVADPRGMMADLQQELTLLQNNDQNTIGTVLFPRIAQVGSEYVRSNTTRAYDRIESLAPKAKDKPDAIIKGINAVMDRAARDPRYYASILKGAGISSSGGYDPNKVLQAIGR
jgi:hypothetical protein